MKKKKVEGAVDVVSLLARVDTVLVFSYEQNVLGGQSLRQLSDEEVRAYSQSQSRNFYTLLYQLAFFVMILLGAWSVTVGEVVRGQRLFIAAVFWIVFFELLRFRRWLRRNRYLELKELLGRFKDDCTALFADRNDDRLDALAARSVLVAQARRILDSKKLFDQACARRLEGEVGVAVRALEAERRRLDELLVVSRKFGFNYSKKDCFNMAADL